MGFTVSHSPLFSAELLACLPPPTSRSALHLYWKSIHRGKLPLAPSSHHLLPGVFAGVHQYRVAVDGAFLGAHPSPLQKVFPMTNDILPLVTVNVNWWMCPSHDWFATYKLWTFTLVVHAHTKNQNLLVVHVATHRGHNSQAISYKYWHSTFVAIHYTWLSVLANSE